MTDHSIPEALPVISAGKHSTPKSGACVMEYVSMIAGEEFSDHPACTHPALAAAARLVNDRLPDRERYRLVPLICRLFGTGDISDSAVSVGLANWAASAAAANAVASAAAAAAANAVASAAANAAAAAAAASATVAADAAYVAAYAADAAEVAADVAADAAYAATATYAAAVGAAALVTFLAGLLDEYDRLTGRTEAPDISDGLTRAAALAG